MSINFYYYSDIDISYYLAYAQKTLEYFATLIGTYPYPSLDIVESELFLEGGMEYPQIIFMDSDYLAKKESYKTIVHELAHQWFYNTVGNNQITDAWQDEGLASLIQDMFLYEDDLDKQMESTYAALKNRLSLIKHPLLDSDISVYESWGDYYNIQYVKGKLMFYSLRKKMGEEKFTEFLKMYYNTYSFKVASRDDLFHTAESVYGASLQDFFTDWFYGTGLPPL